MKVIVAMSQFNIVGCVAAKDYRGCDARWPHGYQELLGAQVPFDVVDVDMEAEMATAYINHFAPQCGGANNAV